MSNTISKNAINRIYKFDPQAAIPSDTKDTYNPEQSLENNRHSFRKNLGFFPVSLALPFFAPIEAVKKILGDSDLPWSEIGKSAVAPLLTLGVLFKDGVMDPAVHGYYARKSQGGVYDVVEK